MLKDWRVVLYLIVGIFSIAYIVYSVTYSKVIVSFSNVLPNNSVVYKIGDCNVKKAVDFYNCIKNETVIVYTSEGNILVNQEDIPLLYSTKVIEDRIIKLGIDIAGGYRIILKPQEDITFEELVLSAGVIENRLNAYGVKSINIKISTDMEGGKYVIIEIPESEENLIDIVQRQGKFEAKIGNTTVFTSGDVLAIHTTPDRSGIRACYRVENGWLCEFYFSISVSKEAADRFAEATKNLSVIFEGGGVYLSEELVLYLDGVEKDRLKISADLRGKAVTEATISGPGYGNTEEEARKNALENMRQLQIILKSGTLPTKFDIVRTERIPPIVGNIVLDSILLSGILAFLGVSGLILTVYRKIKIAMLLILNIILEIAITFAIGILIGQTFDLPAIAGILIAIGTGVDDQIITVEEIIRGRKELDVEKKIKKVMFIIITSFLTLFVAMFPLFTAGLGLLRGFATMTIIGILVGMFITRPAFVRLAEKLL